MGTTHRAPLVVRTLASLDFVETVRLAALLVAFGGGLLWLSHTPLPVLPSEIVDVSSAYAIRSDGEWRWHEALRYDGRAPFWLRGLRRGDEEFPLGDATVSTAPGSVVRLEQLPRVAMETGEEDQPSAERWRVSSLQGALRFTAGKSSLVLTLDDATIRLPEAGLLAVVRRSNAPDWEFSVLRGTVAVGTGLVAKEAGEGAVFRLGRGEKGTFVRDLHRLPFTPRYPVAGSRVTFAPPTERIDFAWDGEAAALLELDNDPSFPSPRTIRSSSSSARADVGAGRYYWRLRTATGLSLASSFSVVPRLRYDLVDAPKKPYRAQQAIELSWAPLSWAPTTLVEVAEDARFEKVVVSRTVAQANTLSVKLREPGYYYWRVRGVHPEWGEWDPSTSRRFRVVGVKKAAPKAVEPGEAPVETPETPAAPPAAAATVPESASPGPGPASEAP